MPRRRFVEGPHVIAIVLVLLSCTHQKRTVLRTETVVKVDAPVRARLDRDTVDVEETAGCGWTGGTGKGIPFPSCSASRCSSEHRTKYECTLIVEGEKRVEEKIWFCAEHGGSMKVDARGERFAIEEFDGHGHQVFAGGRTGTLASWIAATGPPLRIRAPFEWANVPPATDIVADAYRMTAAREDSPRRETTQQARKYLDELEALDRGGFIGRLAELASADKSTPLCSDRLNGWVGAWLEKVRALTPASRVELITTLAASLEAHDGKAAQRIHGILLMEPRELVERIKGPARWLDAHRSDEDAVVAALVLTGWSREEPTPAAAYACSRLGGGTLSDDLRDAALGAIARARLSCGAVKSQLAEADFCFQREASGERELFDEEKAFAALRDADKASRSVDLCAAGAGALAAAYAQRPPITRAELQEICESRTRPANEDASAEDASHDGSSDARISD